MKKLSYKKIHQSQEYLSSLGKVQHRALFGGYSLAIDKTVFAMVAEGELYLRVCEQSVLYQVTHPAPLLKLFKRGRFVLLNYYHVNETLWRDRHILLQLSAHSLQDARREKCQLRNPDRLKDLPNITYHMEMLLFDAGIKDSRTLRELGAEMVWLKLRDIKKQLSTSVLFALEGAIMGIHAAALPVARRRELIAWVDALSQDN